MGILRQGGSFTLVVLDDPAWLSVEIRSREWRALVSDASAELVEAPQPSLHPLPLRRRVHPPSRRPRSRRHVGCERAWRHRLSWAEASFAVDITMLVAAAFSPSFVSREPAIPLVSTIAFSATGRGESLLARHVPGADAAPADGRDSRRDHGLHGCGRASWSLFMSSSATRSTDRSADDPTVARTRSSCSSPVASRSRCRRGEPGAAGEGASRTLIVGAGNVGRLVATRLCVHPEMGLKPVGFLDKTPLYSSEELHDLPVLGASWDLDEVVREQGIEHVIVTFSTAPTAVLLRVLKRCEELGVRASFVPRLYETSTEQFTVESIGGIPLVTGHSPQAEELAVRNQARVRPRCGRARLDRALSDLRGVRHRRVRVCSADRSSTEPNALVATVRSSTC